MNKSKLSYGTHLQKEFDGNFSIFHPATIKEHLEVLLIFPENSNSTESSINKYLMHNKNPKLFFLQK